MYCSHSFVLLPVLSECGLINNVFLQSHHGAMHTIHQAELWTGDEFEKTMNYNNALKPSRLPSTMT